MQNLVSALYDHGGPFPYPTMYARMQASAMSSVLDASARIQQHPNVLVPMALVACKPGFHAKPLKQAPSGWQRVTGLLYRTPRGGSLPAWLSRLEEPLKAADAVVLSSQLCAAVAHVSERVPRRGQEAGRPGLDSFSVDIPVPERHGECVYGGKSLKCVVGGRAPPTEEQVGVLVAKFLLASQQVTGKGDDKSDLIAALESANLPSSVTDPVVEAIRSEGVTAKGLGRDLIAAAVVLLGGKSGLRTMDEWGKARVLAALDETARWLGCGGMVRMLAASEEKRTVGSWKGTALERFAQDIQSDSAISKF
jgi:hypothetical protein